jgi:hypothetical protein
LSYGTGDFSTITFYFGKHEAPAESRDPVLTQFTAVVQPSRIVSTHAGIPLGDSEFGGIVVSAARVSARKWCNRNLKLESRQCSDAGAANPRSSVSTRETSS